MYETISIVPQIKELIEQCPFTEAFSINLNPIGYENYTQDNQYEQGLINNAITEIRDIRTNICCQREIVFKRIVSFFFMQNKPPTDTDSSLVDWCTNFIEWITWLDDNDKVPKFSYTRYADGSIKKAVDSEHERIWTQNAQLIGTEENGMSTYIVDIHLIYSVKY